MALAYHVIITCYGFWLPNDPRGSGSTYVGMDDLYDAHGPATTVNANVSRRPHDRDARHHAKTLLPRPPVRLTDSQIDSVATGFGAYATESEVRILALAVLPDHVHMVMLPHKYRTEMVINQLKRSATRQLRTDGLWTREETPWSRGERFVFLGTPARVRQTIQYTQRNLAQYGRPIVSHPFLASLPEWVAT